MQCKFIKITSNSTQNRQKTQKAQKDKTKFSKKIVRNCRPIEQNNDHTQIMHGIQFRGSFNGLCKFSNICINKITEEIP